MDKERMNEMLETLSEAIVMADENGNIGLGDRLFEMINELRAEWGMDED